MKNILKTILFAFCLITVGSCEDEIDPKVSANGFALRASSVAPVVLTPQTDSNAVTTLSWDKSDNGVGASVATYKVEIAESGTNFANAVLANSGNDIATDRSYTLKAGELNTLINQLPNFQCGVAMSIDIRVKSTLGAGFYNAFVQYSTNVITLSATPYSSTLPVMAVSATGTVDAATPRLAASGVLNTDYEGYMYLTPGTYKFYKPNACGDFTGAQVYGDDGSGALSTLVADGAGYVVATAGYYLVRVNLPDAAGDLTYSVRPIVWNIFGTSKQNFQLVNTPLTYDQAEGVWKATVNLNKGYGFKFRATGNQILLGKYLTTSVGTPNYGGTDLSYVPNTTTLASLPTNELALPGLRNPITLASFTIVLDLRKPRDYKYSITLNE
jgi:hypothetical protein